MHKHVHLVANVKGEKSRSYRPVQSLCAMSIGEQRATKQAQCSNYFPVGVIVLDTVLWLQSEDESVN